VAGTGDRLTPRADPASITAMASESHRWSWLDIATPVGDLDGDRAFFGRDVLQGLIDGLAEFTAGDQQRWQRPRRGLIGPALLGCTPWLNDGRLLDAVAALPGGVCIVISKPPMTEQERRMLTRLQAFNELAPGFAKRALSELRADEPTTARGPAVVGPHDPVDTDFVFEPVRTAWWRRTGRSPLPHAKLALVGHRWWGVDDFDCEVDVFTPVRLWLSSANFTFGSRRNLEFGVWTEDAKLLDAARRFVVGLVGLSEPLASKADRPEPELAPVKYDDAAFADYLTEVGWFDDEEDDG
jgi:hypothetical protein